MVRFRPFGMCRVLRSWMSVMYYVVVMSVTSRIEPPSLRDFFNFWQIGQARKRASAGVRDRRKDAIRTPPFFLMPAHTAAAAESTSSSNLIE